VLPWGGLVTGDTLGRVSKRCYLGEGRRQVLPWLWPVAGVTLGRVGGCVTLAVAGGRCYLGEGRWQVLPWGGSVAGVTLGRVSEPVLRVRVMKESQVAELSVTRAGAAHETTLTSSVLMFCQGKNVVCMNKIGFILHLNMSYKFNKSSLLVNVSSSMIFHL
jgi:hypothetical protein